MARELDEDPQDEKRRAKNAEVYNAEGWTEAQLRQLSVLQASEYGEPLERLFLKLQKADAERIFDERTDFPSTQFARGRLSMLREIDDFLRETARVLYDMRVAAGQRKPGVTP